MIQCKATKMVRCDEIGTGYTTNSVLARGEGGYSFNIYMQFLIMAQFFNHCAVF